MIYEYIETLACILAWYFFELCDLLLDKIFFFEVKDRNCIHLK